MGFKPRGYDREEWQSKTRDYNLFAIACEGTEREPEYFRPFNNGIDRIKVDIIQNETGNTASAPKRILELAKNYIDEIGLSEKDGDTLWFVVDVDLWPREQLEELADFCRDNPNWNMAVSNPCFEIWLLYHKLSDLKSLDCTTAKLTKQALHGLEKGGYYWRNYLPLIENAIKYAMNNDTNPQHYYPGIKESKVYHLAEAILNRVGIPRFQRFIENIKNK